MEPNMPVFSTCHVLSPTELYFLFFILSHCISYHFFHFSTFCSKEIVNFHRPKAKWYPHENKLAAQLQGVACNQGRMTVILMTLGGKGVKLVFNVDETPVSVKLKVSKKLG
jgi:hypothetical protein